MPERANILIFAARVLSVMRNLFLFVGLLGFLSGAIFHPFHVSVTTLTLRDNHFEIIIYTFPDDLQSALEKNYDFTPDWDNPGKKEKYFTDLYLHENFRIFVNDQNLPYTYLGFTFENDRMLLLAESDSFQRPRRIKIIQRLLTDIYADQQNIVHILLGDKKFSAVLDKTQYEFEVLTSRNKEN